MRGRKPRQSTGTGRACPAPTPSADPRRCEACLAPRAAECRREGLYHRAHAPAAHRARRHARHRRAASAAPAAEEPPEAEYTPPAQRSGRRAPREARGVSRRRGARRASDARRRRSTSGGPRCTSTGGRLSTRCTTPTKARPWPIPPRRPRSPPARTIRSRPSSWTPSARSRHRSAASRASSGRCAATAARFPLRASTRTGWGDGTAPARRESSTWIRSLDRPSQRGRRRPPPLPRDPLPRRSRRRGDAR